MVLASEGTCMKGVNAKQRVFPARHRRKVREVAALIQRYEYVPEASERQEPGRATHESHSSSRAVDYPFRNGRTCPRCARQSQGIRG